MPVLEHLFCANLHGVMKKRKFPRVVSRWLSPGWPCVCALIAGMLIDRALRSQAWLPALVSLIWVVNAFLVLWRDTSLQDLEKQRRLIDQHVDGLKESFKRGRVKVVAAPGAPDTRCN